MTRNIFDIAKDVVRELRDADWQFISSKEAAEELITQSEEYFDTGRTMQDILERHKFVDALAGEFDSWELQPQKKTTTALPEDVDTYLLADVLFYAFSSYNRNSTDTRAYKDFYVLDEEDRSIYLIVAEPKTFDFEEAIRKIDFYKIAAPRQFVEFTIGGEQWVRQKQEDKDLGGLHLLSGTQAYHLTPQGEIIPQEISLPNLTEAKKIDLGFMMGLMTSQDIELTEEQMNAININAEVQQRVNQAEYFNLAPEGSRTILACPKAAFLARMKELGIKLPEKDGPT